MLPPEKTDVDDVFICDVFAFNVRFVDVVKFTGVVPLNVNVLDPSVIVLTFELLDDKEPAVTL